MDAERNRKYSKERNKVGRYDTIRGQDKVENNDQDREKSEALGKKRRSFVTSLSENITAWYIQMTT